MLEFGSKWEWIKWVHKTVLLFLNPLNVIPYILQHQYGRTTAVVLSEVVLNIGFVYSVYYSDKLLLKQTTSPALLALYKLAKFGLIVIPLILTILWELVSLLPGSGTSPTAPSAVATPAIIPVSSRKSNNTANYGAYGPVGRGPFTSK
jgi:hypothetical protein